jgi:hypothetical protein
VTVIATTPVSLATANTMLERFGLSARRRAVTPTIKLDWIVKKAKELKARSRGVRKWPVLLLAAVKTLMRTPDPTQNAVVANHMRDHLAGISQR